MSHMLLSQRAIFDHIHAYECSKTYKETLDLFLGVLSILLSRFLSLVLQGNPEKHTPTLIHLLRHG